MQNKPEEVKAPAYYQDKFWGRFARIYDLVIKLFLLPFGGEERYRKDLVYFANPGKGERVLDVCSGTGTLSSLIAGRVGDSGTVTGVDLSARMVEIARKKVKEGLPLTFERASSENLPFPDGIFDRSFISLGLHEMPKTARQNTLREIFRTLKPGGSLFALDYNLAEGVLAKLAVKAFVKLAEQEDAYQMLLERMLEKEIGQAGFILEDRKLLLGGISQIIKAGKPLI